MSWPRVALRTMPYPDINLVGLGIGWAQRNDLSVRTHNMPKNCQFIPYWPYITYMLKIEVTTYPKAQSMHGIEV